LAEYYEVNFEKEVVKDFMLPEISSTLGKLEEVCDTFL
jgi:hypothetical protein